MPSFEIKTTAQLQSIMTDIVEKVIDEMSDIISKAFKEEYIQRMVYDSHGSNSIYYNPNGQEFKDNWIWEDIKKSASEVSRKMFFDWKNITNEPDAFTNSKSGLSVGIHGSYVKGWDSDARPYMPEILDKVGLSSRLWVSVYRPQGYWSEFIKDYVTSGKLKTLFDKTFAKYGVKSG